MNTTDPSADKATQPAKEKGEILFACTITKTGTQFGDVILAKGQVIRGTKAQVDALVSIGAATVTGI